MSPCRQSRQPQPAETPYPFRDAVLRDLESELPCTTSGWWRTDPRIAARLLERVRAEIPDAELEALVARYVTTIAAGMRPAGALLQALQIKPVGGDHRRPPRSSP